MALRIVISADEFGCRYLSSSDFAPKMSEEGVTVPFDQVDKFVAALRRIADDLEALQVKGEW